MVDSKTQERLKEIKRSFRLLMNGETSKSMREKGMDYHLNWGVSFIDLKTMAADYGKDYSLAVELWKENIRECKILATLIMPPEEMATDLAELWMEQTPTQEIAEMLAFNLFQYLDYAPARYVDTRLSRVGFHNLARPTSGGYVNLSTRPTLLLAMSR